MSGPTATGRLLCRSGALAGRTFELGEETRIGRDPSNDIVLELPSVSKQHARIVRGDDGYVLEDLDSTHGTRLDGSRLSAPTPLTRLHVIELSDVEFVFTPPSGSATSAAGARDDESSAAGTPDRPGPPAGRADGPDDGARGTIVDQGGFGTLPDLDRSPGTSGSGSPDPAGGADGGGTDRPDGEDESEPDDGGTMVDVGGFGTLPNLERARETGSAQASGERADDSAGSDTPPDTPGDGRTDEPGEPPGEDGGATRIMTPAPSELSARYEVSVELPDGGPTTFPLSPGDNIVGRGDDCDIKIVDPAMWLSRKHAILRVKDDGVELVDLKGVNGTFVDGRRIDTAMLEPGSTFVLGPHLEFKLRER